MTMKGIIARHGDPEADPATALRANASTRELHEFVAEL